MNIEGEKAVEFAFNCNGDLDDLDFREPLHSQYDTFGDSIDNTQLLIDTESDSIKALKIRHIEAPPLQTWQQDAEMSLEAQIEERNRNNAPKKTKTVLVMELDPDSAAREKFQETCLLYLNLYKFFILPTAAIECGKNSEKLMDIEIRKKNPHEQTFEIGSNPQGSSQIRLYDQFVSPSQAKIVYKDFYRPYFTFLLCLNKTCFSRYNRTSLSKKLPSEIHRLILDFVGPRTPFFIEDNGSQEGTFELVSSRKPAKLFSGQEIQISPDTRIAFLQVSSRGGGIDDKTHNKIKKLIKYDHVWVAGYGCAANGDSWCNEIRNFNKDHYEETRDFQWNSDFDLPVSFLKMEVRTKAGKIQRVLILPHEKINFIVGRDNDADVRVASVHCSRNHCAINYSNQTHKWTIIDGFRGKSSLAGTWNSLQTIKERKEKIKSKPVPITDGSLFKLGANYFRFSYKKIRYC